MKTFYITTPIYYVNDAPHIGHAYTTVAADMLARFYRLKGKEVFFSTGTDEHGAKIEAKARASGLEPKTWVDQISAQFQLAWDELDISYNRFIRTTDAKHKEAVQAALKYLYEKGDIYKGEYEGLYCRGCEQFKSQRDLVDGKCPDHNIEPEVIKQEAYLFRLSKYAPQILAKIKAGELKINPPTRLNEIISFLTKEGLHDISFSRTDVDWGVELPWDQNHTAYVWADAFLNYLTVLGWRGEVGKAPDFWPPNLQLMSKDILRVHATIWPAMLLALDLDLPQEFFVHGFFLIEGQKMSKTLGNIIRPQDLVKKYGAQATRYLLLASTPFGHDGDVSWEKFSQKYNADLANGLGNLLQRVIALTFKYNQGKVPTETDKTIIHDEGSREQLLFKDAIEWSWQAIEDSFAARQLDQVLASTAQIVNMCDRHISAIELWKFLQSNLDEGLKHLYSLLEVLRQLAVMLWPCMPGISEEIWLRLGLDPGQVLAEDLHQLKKWGGLNSGLELKKKDPLFPRLKNAN
jgi:methionyl-tRNA synthetase